MKADPELPEATGTYNNKIGQGSIVLEDASGHPLCWLSRTTMSRLAEMAIESGLFHPTKAREMLRELLEHE